MTVINGIEIDNIKYKQNEIKDAIKNNDPIEERLNVIIVISNPCLYAKRYILLKEFVQRMQSEDHINLFIVEMIYNNQKFIVTEKGNINHLQLKTQTPLWHKENMINLGVKYLLPKDYRSFAWVDADIEFENNSWALDTLKILNGCKDIVQLFSHCIDMDSDETNLNIFNSFGYSYVKEKKYTTRGLDYWHPGYAWAMTRKMYESINQIYDKGILGSGDNIMALSFINRVKNMNNQNYSKEYNQSMLDFEKKSNRFRLGYVPGVIRHHYHGSKQNRKYTERWKILMKWQYTPDMLQYDSQGILVPTDKLPQGFKQDILNYFRERQEDN
jgi:hypothetical protein